MTRPQYIALMLCLAAPVGAQAAGFSLVANQTCADQLFSRPEGVMKAAQNAAAVALELRFGRKTPDAATRERAARALGAGIAELQRLRAALDPLEAPESAAQDWDALLGVVDFKIRLAGNREAVLRGTEQQALLATDSPVPNRRWTGLRSGCPLTGSIVKWRCLPKARPGPSPALPSDECGLCRDLYRAGRPGGAGRQ
ncbi:hypothetical protein [Gemmobacter sp. 24YEA27]|uniref:hypothetical protein n=1 Tax=Gemmobacter sp. 24YEA27 TaxID=3040672 RepID=UPI0024B3520D|nr:hypothetical protein [Gemmobacter sp. 24YEA27]